jgi:hypothetical protein
MTFACEINGPRGWGGNNTIIINAAHLMNGAKFQALFVHEMGHVSSDTEGASASSKAKNTAYSDPIATITEDNKNLAYFELSWTGFDTLRNDSAPIDFVSGYAQTNVHEDLAESIAAYVTYGNNFQYEASSNDVLAAKYDFIKNIFFDGQSFNTGTFTTLPNVYDITGE